MARFRHDEADKYGGQGGAGYFSLKDDKDVATVRFMYNSVDDVTGYAVHQVEIDGKKRYVNCLREYNQPKDVCPFCKANMFTTAKLFIPVYNVDDDKVQMWERGKKFIAQISGICARYGTPSVVAHKFEIERNGKKGDTSTTYGIYEIDKDETTLEDLPEAADPLGTVILDKSAEDMEYFLDNESFPSDDAPVRRRSSRNDEEPPFEEDRRSSRRTPANRRDRF